MGSHEDGMRVRRRVLGDAHVDSAVAATTDLDRKFQEWITANVWGDLWTGEVLTPRERSLVTMAILGALNHEELELHLKASVNTGVSQEEVAEVLLHVGVYAGAPAANRAFKVAKQALKEADG